MGNDQSLHEIIKIIKRNVGLIVLLMSLAIAISAIVTYFLVSPVYESTSQVLISQNQDEKTALATEDIQMDLQLVNTYTDIIKSPAILDQVNRKLGLDYSSSELAGKITVSASENSQVVTIAATDSKPDATVRLANTTAQTVVEEIPKLMKVENISVLYSAILSEDLTPVTPNIWLNMSLAAIAGLLLGIGAAFFTNYLDTTIKNGQDVKNSLEIPVLGQISTFSEIDQRTRPINLRERRGE